MAPPFKTPCTFFARGLCRNGDSCNFVHEKDASNQSRGSLAVPVIPSVEKSRLKPLGTAHINDTTNSTQVCAFFMKGRCSRGSTCRFSHPSTAASPQQVNPDAIAQETSPPQRQQQPRSSQAIPDSRAEIPCIYFASSKGCQNRSCPYLHIGKGQEKGQEVDGTVSQEVEAGEAGETEDREPEDDFSRTLSGALVSFDEIGRVDKVSFPTDFSVAYITGVEPKTTPEALIEIFRGYGFNIDVNCVRISEQSTTSELKVLVKVENPLFAHELSNKLKSEDSNLGAVPLPIDARRSNCRKVHVSWHKASRTVWLNFGNQVTTERVAQKFNDSVYRILGQSVKSSAVKYSGGGFHHNPRAWTIILSDVPDNTNVEEIKTAIKLLSDQPRHIELGPTSYYASDHEVSAQVRSLLEKHGPLENFHLSLTSKGKRVKAAAIFLEESDARSACSLNNTRLPALNGGKLTVTLVQSAKIKIQTRFYRALKSRIDEQCKIWKEQQVMYRAYQSVSQPFTTLKIESSDMKEFARARRALDEISSGIIIRDGEDVLWSAALYTNGDASEKLKTVEKDLDVIIHRNKSKRQLNFYGSPEKLQEATVRVARAITEDSSTCYEIELSPDQFSWLIRGGFKSVQQALGEGVAIFNVVSKSITISGTREQYETASAIVKGKSDAQITAISSDRSITEQSCPICLCEADNPLQTSCNHVYCLGALKTIAGPLYQRAEINFRSGAKVMVVIALPFSLCRT